MKISSLIESKGYSIALLSALVLSFLTAKVYAQQSTNDLWESCQALGHQGAGGTSEKAENDTLCYQYIRGFLEGAVITDTQIMRELAKTNSKSDFAQRAIRTRVGKTRATDADTYLANFCLPDTRISQEMINKVAANLVIPVNTQQDIGPRIYQAVKQVYPCKP